MVRKAKRKAKIPNADAEMRYEAILGVALERAEISIPGDAFGFTRLWDGFFLATRSTPGTQVLVFISQHRDDHRVGRRC
jgi:hypothetical protein